MTRRTLPLIATAIAAALIAGVPARAETVTLWCGNDQVGYNFKFVVDYANSTVEMNDSRLPIAAQINGYAIAWNLRTTMPWHGGTAVNINWYRIDRVKGIYSHGFNSWVEYGGEERQGTEDSGKDGDLNCVKGDKPPAPATKF